MNAVTRKELNAIFKDAGIDSIDFSLSRNGVIRTFANLLTHPMYTALAKYGLHIKRFEGRHNWREYEYTLSPAPTYPGWTLMWKAFQNMHFVTKSYDITVENIHSRAIYSEGEDHPDAVLLFCDDEGEWIIFTDPTRLYNTPIGPEAEPAVTVEQVRSGGMLHYQDRAVYDGTYRVLAIEPDSKGTFSVFLDGGNQFRMNVNVPGNTPLKMVGRVNAATYEIRWSVSRIMGDYVSAEVYPFAGRGSGVSVNCDLRTYEVNYGWYSTIADADHLDRLIECMQIVRHIGDKLALGVIEG